MTTLDGAGNDIVKVFLDGNLIHTGTSWEDYYPQEQPGHPSPFSVDTFLLRAGGTSVPGNMGGGYYFDNFKFDASNAPVVPEPATLSLIGLGLAGVGMLRRRARKS